MSGKVINRLQQLLAEKEMKEGRRMTLKEHADKLDLHPRSLARWIDSENPTTRYDAEILAKFCKYFGVEVGDIIVYIPEVEE